MCGIFGILGNCGNRGDIADQMDFLLQHRGPDDSGRYTDSDILLGHRRLSIIGVDNGHQPIHNEDETVWVSYNGEIYNYESIKKELQGLGHEFYTETDTEVLVHLYEEYGIDFLSELNGMYAFALWDANRRKLFLTRDGMGIKPLYYLKQEETVAFASELKALVQSGLHQPSVSEDGLREFLFHRYIPDSMTFFTSVNKLLQGEVLTVDSSLNISRTKVDEVDGYEGELHSLLESSVKRRLMSEVPLGTFLSGGIDSSSVTGFASMYTEDDIKTFSVHFDDNTESELPYANEVADHFGTDHRPTLVSEEEVIEKLPLMAWHYDEPMGDAAVVPTFLVAESASDDLTVVLAGEGSDEQFAGYGKYKEMLKYAERESDSRRRAREYMQYISVFMPEHLRNLVPGMDVDGFEQELLDFIQPQFEEDDILNAMLYFDQHTMLSENYLMKADKMTMAHSVEDRVPFLDPSIVGFSRQLVAEKKLQGDDEKHILKEAMTGTLPDSIVDRKKQGYGTPREYWFRHKIGALFKQRIDESLAFSRYFDTDYVHTLLDEHRSGESNHKAHLWSLLAFDLWHAIYIERECSRPIESYYEFFNLEYPR